jgi:hypothetical protein
MSQVFSVTTGSTTLAAATAKIAIMLYTSATVQNRIIQFDVTFNGVNAAATPVLLELVTTSGSSSGGSIYTPLKQNTDARVAAGTVARINDTVDGASPVVNQSYFVPPTSGLIIQFPLGREPGVPPSSFWEMRLTAPAVVNYIANLWVEE